MVGSSTPGSRIFKCDRRLAITSPRCAPAGEARRPLHGSQGILREIQEDAQQRVFIRMHVGQHSVDIPFDATAGVRPILFDDDAKLFQHRGHVHARQWGPYLS